MTAKQERETRRTHSRQADPVQDAIEYGIDVSAIRDNLVLTPAERLRRHDMALNTVEMLRKARRV